MKMHHDISAEQLEILKQDTPWPSSKRFYYQENIDSTSQKIITDDIHNIGQVTPINL